MTQVTVTLHKASYRPAGQGHMLIGDGTVDGQETTIIFWDPQDHTRLTPGTSLTVTNDGNTAKWSERAGKVSFQIKNTASYQILGAAAPAQAAPPQAAAPAPVAHAPTQPHQPAHPQTQGFDDGAWSAFEVLDRSAECVAHYRQSLLNNQVPQEIADKACPDAPKLVPLWWFGEKRA